MCDDNPPSGSAAPRTETLDALQQRASDLTREAQAASDRYERTAWIRYMAIFVPVPMVVLLLRLHMEYWGYYLLGALMLAITVAMLVIDAAAVARRDAALDAARRAMEALVQARDARPPGDGAA